MAADLPFLKHISREKLEGFLQTHRALQKRAALDLVCCFNVAQHESNAMWRVYGKGTNCVALTTSLGTLKKSFGQYTDYDVLIGQVKYEDYSTFLLSEANYLSPLLHKTPYYAYENEIRCIVMDDGDNCLFPNDEPNPMIEAMSGLESFSHFKRGAYVPVDVGTLLQEIVVGPDAEDGFLEAVNSVLEKYDIPANARRSALRP